MCHDGHERSQPHHKNMRRRIPFIPSCRVGPTDLGIKTKTKQKSRIFLQCGKCPPPNWVQRKTADLCWWDLVWQMPGQLPGQAHLRPKVRGQRRNQSSFCLTCSINTRETGESPHKPGVSTCLYSLSLNSCNLCHIVWHLIICHMVMWSNGCHLITPITHENTASKWPREWESGWMWDLRALEWFRKSCSRQVPGVCKFCKLWFQTAGG